MKRKIYLIGDPVIREKINMKLHRILDIVECAFYVALGAVCLIAIGYLLAILVQVW